MDIIGLVGTIIITIGTILIYDARQISKRRFSYSDVNNATASLKIVGFVLSTIGGLLIII